MGSKMKLRASRKVQDKALPLDKLEVTMEAKRMFALAIEGIGGLQALIDWAKLNSTNKGMLIAHYAKMIPMSVSSQIDATVTVVEDNQALAALERIILGEMLAQQAEAAERAARAGIVIQDGEDYVAALERTLAIGPPRPIHDGVTIDHEPAEPAPRPATEDARPAPEVHSAQTAAPLPASPAAPRNVVNTRSGPSFPGASAGVLEHLDDGLSTTEKFLLWNGHTGHGKPP